MSQADSDSSSDGEDWDRHFSWSTLCISQKRLSALHKWGDEGTLSKRNHATAFRVGRCAAKLARTRVPDLEAELNARQIRNELAYYQ